MSGDVSMFSDDDTPLSVKPTTTNGAQNGHVAHNGNGRLDDDSSMSEDDDVPLVSGRSGCGERL